MADFVTRKKQTSFVMPEKIAKIVNNNFEQSLCVKWAKHLIKLNAESKASFVSSDACQNFEESWQTAYAEKILQEFCSWCKEFVSLHRAVK